MKSDVKFELALLKGQRDHHSDEIRKIDLQFGRVAAQAISDDEDTSKSAIGRVIGFSHTHVANLIDAAKNSEPPAEQQTAVPIFDNVLAGEYVIARGAKIVRSISAFNPSDVLHQSGLDPRLFAEPDGRINMPAMIWQLDSSNWIGVSAATVGYGGTGCSYSHQALIRAGIPEETATEIVKWRFCDAVNIDEPNSWIKQKIWPIHPRGIPRVSSDRMIVNFGEGLQGIRRYSPGRRTSELSVDETGFYPSDTGLSTLEAWIEFLDNVDQLPPWAQGPRVARVFLNREIAQNQGFVVLSGSTTLYRAPRSSPVVVIEQGFVQLWGHFYQPLDRTQLLPDEAYTALNCANVYPLEIAERDARSSRPWGRFTSRLLGPDKSLPGWIDVSISGKEKLAYTPSSIPVEFYE